MLRKTSPIALAACGLLLAACVGQPPATSPTPAGGEDAATTLVELAPAGNAPSPAALALERAFSALTFDAPTDLQAPQDGTDRLFLAEQAGVIHVFPNRQDVAASTVFLDIRGRVDAHPAGRGLLGFAFDPNYRRNREFYVYYTATDPMRSVLSRFRASATQPDQADVASEEILLTIDQPYQNHKGGQVAFGADGMLYLTSGDGGGGKAPDNGQKNGQDRTTLLGKFLRIDVHPTAGDRPYAIPSDNPFAGNTQGFREEIYAYGLRNPWRAAFDAETGRWFGGDVGQMTLEEINLYEKGGNYGWALMEGTNCFGAADCDPSGLKQPIATYGRDMGFSVTGGYVYRGQRAPALRGAYIYADYVSGRFWALRHDGQRVTHNEVVLKADLSTTTFGQDAQRELYAVGSDGTIHRFR